MLHASTGCLDYFNTGFCNPVTRRCLSCTLPLRNPEEPIYIA